MNTIPKKSDVRSISLFGLSVVTVIFEDEIDDFYAQQYTANRLQSAALPEGADAEIEPPYGTTREIFRYALKSKKPIGELSAIHDWVIERKLVAVPAALSSGMGSEIQKPLAIMIVGGIMTYESYYTFYVHFRDHSQTNSIHNNDS